MGQESIDNKLVMKLVQQGNLKAFEKLYNSYYDELCIYALKYTPNRSLIEDIVQDTFIDLWSNRKKIRITSSLKGYLCRVVYNKLMDAFKSNSKKNDAYLSYYQSSIKDFASAVENDDDYKTELLENLELCISKLPKRCKNVFLETKISGLKYQQISDKLDISIKTVEGHVRRAYAFLKGCMNDLTTSFS